MKMFRILFLLINLLCFANCGGIKFNKNPGFKIASATYENWIGGQPKIKGIQVKIVLKSKRHAVVFDSIYFQKRVTKLIPRKTNSNELIGHFNTSPVKRDIILDINPTKEYNNSVPEIIKLPFNLKENEAVISYKINEKIKYFKINHLKKVTSTDF